MNLFELKAYDYHLPPELIAQQPVTPRDSSRLMLVDRKSGEIRDAIFRDLADILSAGDSLILNDTRVIPARLFGVRDSGGRCEVFLLKPRGENIWHAMARPGRKMRNGSRVVFGDAFWCEILETLEDGTKLVRFSCEGDFWEMLKQHGQMPLPHYIARQAGEWDAERYQTVFSAQPGAVAAPTAGLHFTEDLLGRLYAKGVDSTAITLHVDLATFRPVQMDDIRQHPMHMERFSISSEAAQKLNNRDLAHRQIVVGTTCCRTLEAAAAKGRIEAGDDETQIFIYPGYEFRYVRQLLTNFHFPRSTLLMLVCALAGYELTMEAYRKAVERRYRFYSYGDAMLLL